MSLLDSFLCFDVTFIVPCCAMAEHDLSELAELVDPETVSNEVKISLGIAFARHECISSANEWCIVKPVHVQSVHCDSLVSAVDGDSLIYSLLVPAHLVADTLVLVSAFHDFECVCIDLSHTCECPVLLVSV